MPFLRTYNNDLVPGLLLQKKQLRGISRGEVLHGRYFGSIFEQHPHGRDGLWVGADGGVNTQISALDIRDVKPSPQSIPVCSASATPAHTGAPRIGTTI